jgi:hypothetical protein
VNQILTYNHTQPVHIKRTPVQSFALLVQVSRIGRVAAWYESMYPKIRWDGEKAYLRRELSSIEARALRKSIYRMWLYGLAFHTPAVSRMTRMNAALVANRTQLLRSWSTADLIELEDVRCFVESIIANICPTNGEVYWRAGQDQFASRKPLRRTSFSTAFYDARDDAVTDDYGHLPASEARERMMEGWGDEIEQYHALSSMLKLSPAHVFHLYEHAKTKQDVEDYVNSRCGAMWFWDNGETMLHSWMVVMHGRGLPVQEIREKICCGLKGIAVDSPGT